MADTTTCTNFTSSKIAIDLWLETAKEFGDAAAKQEQVRGGKWNQTGVGFVGKRKKFLERLLLGQSDTNTDFDDLCALLRELGFDERIKGSHHIFRREAVYERINLQSEGKQAKIYQVRQVRDIILRYGLGGE